MRLRDLFLAAVGAGTVAVGTNAWLRGQAGPLDQPVPGRVASYRWRGMNTKYVVAGDDANPPVVLVHGIHAAATSHQFAPIVEELADEYRVIVPDLPGFGRSDRPPIDYTADLYVDFVEEFTADVAPGAACVASSLGGGYAAIAARDSGVFTHLLLVCPTATTMRHRRPWRRTLLRAPVVGQTAFNLVVSKPAIRWFASTYAYFDPAAVSDEEVAYWWQTAHQPGARFAPASFLSGALDPSVNLGAVLDGVACPVTLVWGREATLTPVSYGRDLADAGGAKLVVFDEARLLPHAEYPDQFCELVTAELSGLEE